MGDEGFRRIVEVIQQSPGGDDFRGVIFQAKTFKGGGPELPFQPVPAPAAVEKPVRPAVQHQGGPVRHRFRKGRILFHEGFLDHHFVYLKPLKFQPEPFHSPFKGEGGGKKVAGG